jgi:hypothetical protein
VEMRRNSRGRVQRDREPDFWAYRCRAPVVHIT